MALETVAMENGAAVSVIKPLSQQLIERHFFKMKTDTPLEELLKSTINTEFLKW